MSEIIRQQREIIDETDKEMIDLLEKRFQASLEIGEQKRLSGIEVLDPSREEAILEDRAKYAEGKGLKPEFIHRLMQLIMEESKAAQEQLSR